MEDENKVLKTIKYIKIGALIIILIIIGIFIYTKWQTNINNERLKNYLKEENYTKENKFNTYTNEKETDNGKIINTALSGKYIFAQRTEQLNNYNYSYYTVEYRKDNTIFITYLEDGFNSKNEEGITSQEGTLKNGKFSCKIISNNNFDTKCDVMQKISEKYKKQIEKLLKENKINTKYITIK